MLLQEYRPFKVDKQLAEQAMKKNKPLIVTGVLQRAEAKNQNGRVYPKEILAREVEQYMKGPVAENRAMGELDHPESSVINLQNVSHTVKKCWWDGDDVIGNVEILNTPAGNILKALFAAGITVGISSRGMGSVEENLSEGTVEVQDDFELLCWDFVSTPSTHGAFMKPSRGINEGKIQVPEYKYTNVNNIIRDIICDNTGTCAC
jgi:hypothetical protein